MSPQRPRWTAERIPHLEGRVAVVTGASSGLGAVTATELAAHGAAVTLAVRDPARGDAVAARIRDDHPGAHVSVAVLDVADLSSVRAFAAAWRASHPHLDILVNNAGVMGLPKRETTRDGFEMQMGTNHLGAFAVTRELWPALAASSEARVVAVASNAHRPARLDMSDLMSEGSYSPWRAYARSKLANLLFTLELQRRCELVRAPVMAVAAHPGWANTSITRGPLTGRQGLSHTLERIVSNISALPAEQGALSLLYAATVRGIAGNDYIGPTGFGEIRGYPGPAKRSPRSLDGDSARRLWELSAELTGGSFLDDAPPRSLG